MLTRLVHAPAVAAADLANLRTIFYGGGPMYVADLERALGLFGPRLYQLYGQGESPMTITGLDQRMPTRLIRIGASASARAACPRTGVLVKVVDDRDRALPAGEVGEIVTAQRLRHGGAIGRTRKPRRTPCAACWLHTGEPRQL